MAQFRKERKQQSRNPGFSFFAHTGTMNARIAKMFSVTERGISTIGKIWSYLHAKVEQCYKYYCSKAINYTLHGMVLLTFRFHGLRLPNKKRTTVHLLCFSCRFTVLVPHPSYRLHTIFLAAGAIGRRGGAKHLSLPGKRHNFPRTEKGNGIFLFDSPSDEGLTEKECCRE